MPTPSRPASDQDAEVHAWSRAEVEAAGSASGRAGDSRGGFGGGAGQDGPRSLLSDQRGYEESFDRYTRMVRRVLDVPIALVTLVEQSRQVFAGANGLPEPYQVSRETPLSHSVCQFVVADEAPLVVSDAREDERLRDSLAIADLGVIAYAGVPLRDGDGRVVGSVCAIDTEPRQWTASELEMLEDLGFACSAELAQRQLRGRATSRAHRVGVVSRRNSLLLALSERLASTRTLADIAVAITNVTREELGCVHAGVWMRPVEDPAHMRAPRAPEPGAVAERLTFVGEADTFSSPGATGAVVGMSRDNPRGRALVTDSVLLFPDGAARNSQGAGDADGGTAGGARAYLPLVVDGQAYAVLALVWPESRVFDADDRATLGTLATYAAQAVQRAVLLQERVDAALTLQRAMLSDLPQPEHLSLAAAYQPAAARDQVGGDWYDAVVTSDGATHLIVGDVVGHDIDAAAVMGQLRSMLRAFAWEHAGEAGSPARNVERLDRSAAELGLDAMATMVSVRIGPEPEGEGGDGPREVLWTNAGHLPPLVVDAEGVAEVLERAHRVDPMLGAIPDAERSDHRLRLAAGSTLVMFTDGLVERRGEPLAVGIERARAALARHHDRTVPEMVARLVEDVLQDEARDDVVVLAARLDGYTARSSRGAGGMRPA